MRLGDALDGLHSQIIPLGPTRGCAQTGILRFTLEIVVYKWLLLIIGEIIFFLYIDNNNNYYYNIFL